MEAELLFTASEFGNCKSVFIEIFNTECKIPFGVVYLPNGNINCFERIVIPFVFIRIVFTYLLVFDIN